VFVADILATTVDRAYGSVTDSSALFLLIATLFFGIQIYCDFNGYTIIARGVAKVLGVDLVENFRQPYLATSISSFWRRWHISLTSWFMDYVYFPLGGSRCSKTRTSFNLLVTFTVSGVWHGAGWTFPIWGLLNGVYLVIEKALGLAQKTKSGFQALIGWLYTCFFVGLSWVFFRAVDLSEALLILKKIATETFADLSGLLTHSVALGQVIPTNGSFIWNLGMGLLGIIAIFGIDIYESRRGSPTERVAKFKPALRWACYLVCLVVTLSFGMFGSTSEFIYFRF
jgi:D-alanyl-lipoteichoic acid acyltransferase DltB (MBOAT superfamily)